MKKYFNFTLLALAILLFTGCSNEEDVTGATGKADPAGTIGFSFPMNKEGVTYATTPDDGDVAIANPNESVIRNVRIYMFSNADNKLVDWQGFSQDDLTATGGKAYFAVTGISGAHTFYAVANADAHVPATLNSIAIGSTIAQFQALVTNNTGASLLEATNEKGLLLVGCRDVADVADPSGVNEKVINLKRRVARFDVENAENDIVPGDNKGTNFKITAIYVSNANYATYLTQEASTGTLPAVGKLNPITYTGSNDGQLNKSVFYLWPTTLGAAETKTVISVEGIFNGVKQLYIVKLAADKPIVGNYRYILKVRKETLSKIAFDIAVDEWNEGGDVTGIVNKTSTVINALTSPTLAGGSLANTAVYDGTVVNFDGSNLTATAELSVEVTSWRSGATSHQVHMINGTSNNTANDITVTKSEGVTYAGGKYTTYYKIAVPKQSSPLDRTLEIMDPTDPANKKTIRILANPNYVGTALKPVLVGGKYWAPVNVGATTDVATTLNQASMGLLFQWGRSYGFAYGTTGDVVTGPLSLAAANNATNSNKFIKVSGHPFNWLDVDGTITTQAQANALWSGDNATPCPEGWTLPTNADLQKLANKYVSTNISANRLSIAGDGGVGTLYLPLAGDRGSDSAVSLELGRFGDYWSSSITPSSVNSYYMHMTLTGVDVAPAQRAAGLSVRCVQK